jgi:hypothetical protein
LLSSLEKDEHVSFEHENFLLPIKNYISEYVTELVDGIPAISISNQIEFLKNDNAIPIQTSEYNIEFLNESIAISQNRKLVDNQLNPISISQISQNLAAYDSAWNNMEIVR